MNNRDLISIIIVNYDGKIYLKNCLDSIYNSSYNKFEVIFVDNGSNDESIKFVKNKYKSVNIIELDENKGFTGGNIEGVKHARGKYFLFLNNDTQISKHLLKNLKQFYDQNKDSGIVQPKIRLLEHKEYLDGVGSSLTFTGFLQHHGHKKKESELSISEKKEIFAAKGACMFVSKDIYEIVGGFDDRFFAYFEETDLCWRVLLMGYKNYYFPEAFMYHVVGRTSSKIPLPIIEFHSFKNRIATLIKNLELKNLLWILPIHLTICVGVASAYVILGKFKNASSILSAMLWNVKNLKKNIDSRKKVQKTRVVSDVEIFHNHMEKIDVHSIIHTLKYYFLKRGKVN